MARNVKEERKEMMPSETGGQGVSHACHTDH